MSIYIKLTLIELIVFFHLLLIPNLGL